MKIKTKYLLLSVVMTVTAGIALYIGAWQCALVFFAFAGLFVFVFITHKNSTEYDTVGTINNMRKDLMKKHAPAPKSNKPDWEKYVISISDDFDYGIDDEGEE